MTTQELKCFVAVAEHLSFSTAAKELYFSTATVSHHIQHLENEIGVALFIRNKMMVKLTRAGEMFYQDAKDILERQKIAVNRITKYSWLATMNVGCSSQAELWMMQPVLSWFHKKYPGIEPHIVVENYGRLITQLNDGTLDFILASSHMAKKTSFTFCGMTKIKTYALMKKDHSLAEREQIDFEEISDEYLILPKQSMIPYQSDNPIRDLLIVHGEHHNDIMEEDDQIMLMLTAAGYGIAVLPGYRVPMHYKELGLVAVPINENVDFSYGIMYKEKKDKVYLNDFMKKLENHLKTISGHPWR